MRRSLTRRLTSLALLLVFLGVGAAEAYAVRECPHHDLTGPLVADGHGAPRDVAARGGSRDVSAETSRAASGTALAGLPARDLVRAPAQGDARHDPAGTEAPCSCVGTCHAAADAPLGSSGHAADRLARRIDVRPPLAPATAPLPDAPSYLLPYPNGPPLSA